MTDFFFEWAVREQMRELERVNRTLERWGWCRRGGQASERPEWRFRLGAALVRMGRWLQDGCGKEGNEPPVLACLAPVKKISDAVWRREGGLSPSDSGGPQGPSLRESEGEDFHPLW